MASASRTSSTSPGAAQSRRRRAPRRRVNIYRCRHQAFHRHGASICVGRLTDPRGPVLRDAMIRGRPSNHTTPIDVALRLCRSDFVEDTRRAVHLSDVIRAVADRDTPAIFDWIASLLPLQGISDAAAMTFQREHGAITWAEIEVGLLSRGGCPRLRSWWHFRCGFRKSAWTCANPDFIDFCALPAHDLRKGSLNEAVFGLFLFIRDACGGDLVEWIDRRLASADVDIATPARGQRMSAALVDALAEVPGTGRKIWSMILADLLLAGDPARERWVAAGASMVAIDRLVHAWLHRTGKLREQGAEHAYGPRCYRPGGCAEVIERIAQTIDARVYNASFPSFFPRLVQVAIWDFCAEGGRNICNGRHIEDRYACRQVFCPAGPGCARLPLKMV